MSIGLGIDKVHESGITGQGISVAICDWPLNEHTDLKIKEKQYADYQGIRGICGSRAETLRGTVFDF